MAWIKSFRYWIWQDDPSDEREGIETTIKNILRILCLVFSGFAKHGLELRASALTYTVILSLVPVLAMGTALVKGLGADNYMKQAAYRMLEEMEALSEHKGFTDTNSSSINATALELHSQSTKHLKVAIDKIFDYVDKTNFAALGWLGIVASLLTVVSLMTHIEEAMNTIWETKKSRDIGRKIIDYIGLIVLMPLSINIAFWAITANQSKAFIEKMTNLLKISWLLPIIFKLLPLLMIIGTFTILYRFMPNTWVRWWPATIGGLIGGIGWILAQTVYIKLQIGVARYNAIYGSFATLPLFLFWVYIGWIIFLIGAETSYAVQNFKRLNPMKKILSPVEKLALAIDILHVAYHYFDKGKPVTPDILSEKLKKPLPEVDQVIGKLLEANLLKRTDRVEEFLPAISKRGIKNAMIFDALCGSPKEPKSLGEKLTASFYYRAVEGLDEFSNCTSGSEEASKKGA